MACVLKMLKNTTLNDSFLRKWSFFYIYAKNVIHVHITTIAQTRRSHICIEIMFKPACTELKKIKI